MKLYQCSKCDKLATFDEKCMCVAGVDPRPKYREEIDRRLCSTSFVELPTDKRWHEKLSWEK